MPQVMIGLSVRDDKTTAEVWRMAKRSLNPAVRRRIGWRGRSSLLREFLLYGFETASRDPDAFLRSVRDAQDPLLGHKGRRDVATEKRQEMIHGWESYFPAAKPPRPRKQA